MSTALSTVLTDLQRVGRIVNFLHLLLSVGGLDSHRRVLRKLCCVAFPAGDVN